MQERYYVAIGASAGGLEALEEFFKSVPHDTGLTFFVIQHLSPDYKSLMDELLARYTKMNIYIAKNEMQVEENCIYLIPPKKTMSIFNESLILEDQKKSQNHISLPIDIFFKSLAKDQGKKSIGVILSGTGSDGRNGIIAIKEAGGMVISQDELSAKFDGMPKSAISTGLVDLILPPNQMINEIIEYVKHPSVKIVQDKLVENEVVGMDSIKRIALILRNYCDIDFTSYKENTLYRRLERRIKINKIDNINMYIDFLRENSDEKEKLKRDLLIGVTSFFRDIESYNAIESLILPNLNYQNDEIRIWSAGCSSGEEAYSLAIMLEEYIKRNNIDCDYKIFATDVDDKALEIASSGIYPDSSFTDMDAKFLVKYFKKTEDGYEINEKIRKKIVFAKHNILKDPPFSKLDILVCRNLFIYLKSENQQKILYNFYYSLKNSGYLVLGSSETIGDMNMAFDVIDSKWKIYKYNKNYNRQSVFSDFSNNKASALSDISSKMIPSGHKNKFMEKLLSSVVSKMVDPSIILSSDGTIIHLFGDTSDFMRFQPGRFSDNYSSNMPKEMSLFVSNILRRLKDEQKEIIFNNIKYNDSENAVITIKGNPVQVNNTNYYLITFIKTKTKSDEKIISVDMSEEVKQKIKQLEAELQLSQEGLQATIEELETSNEELQSSNEELIASNEELQSTNEELQSVNEELYTVNNEYQQKIDELTNLTNDLDNLLKNTNIGALYLDKSNYIRRINAKVRKITNIRNNDLGRPITDISVNTNYPELIDDINYVCDTLIGVEKEIRDSQGNFWLVKIRPFRTEYNSVEGTILTFVDINMLKQSQKEVEILDKRIENLFSQGNIIWYEINAETRKMKASEFLYTLLDLEYTNRNIKIDDIHSKIVSKNKNAIKKSFNRFLNEDLSLWNELYQIQTSENKSVWIHDIAYITENENGSNIIFGTIIDVSKLERFIK